MHPVMMCIMIACHTETHETSRHMCTCHCRTYWYSVFAQGLEVDNAIPVRKTSGLGWSTSLARDKTA
jgi:hypothetical protein